MALPTFSQIVQSMISFLQGSRPNVATQTGSVVNDVVISTVANQLSAQNGTDVSVYSQIQYVQNLQSFVVNAATILPADLDIIATNYGMTRLPGTQATGSITLRIRNYTTSSPIVTITAGTTVSTLSTSAAPAVSFSTTSTITFSPSLAPSYYNPVSGFYEQNVGIISQTIGTIGNVAAATITSLVGPGLGIDAVTNTTATTGGTNIESNVAFAARIQIKLSGNNVGTPDGIISLVSTNPNVQQAIVVGPNDPEMERDQFGGSVDVYIQGQILTTVTDAPLYSTTGSQVFILNHQPALTVGSITGVVAALPYTFVAGTDYQVVLNPNSLFALSTAAGSYVTFDANTFFNVVSVVDGLNLEVDTTTGMSINNTIHQGIFSATITTVTDATHIAVTNTAGFGVGNAYFTGLKPDNNTLITITYTYDSLIETLQALFNDDSNHIAASDILVREAIQALMNVTASIAILPGYVPATVISAVQTNLTIYLNSLGLGAVIDLSDLVVVIEATPGVDAIALDTLVMQAVKGLIILSAPPGQRISVGKNAYPVANSLVITV